ncbi:MAG: hypothetical protein KIT73_10365, partial [Burkholderiales bacterium]|nr:hypothetical protein [Burkholderiales bacterium]
AREKPPEQETPPPAMPRLEGMLPLTVENFHSGTASIDAGSIVVGPDEVVRYVLLTTSDDGRKQTSYEGIRCGPNEWRTYYIGRADGGWIRDVTSRWQPASDGGHSSIRYTLATEYFCDPDGMPWRSAYDIRDRLEGAPSSSVLRRRKDY